ncbi:MAG: methyltransferase domain-containing protein [Chloroflexi bacterium]|nr:methyltransferase domain-containing protein [Chloroflexota bacterium]
MPDVELFIQEKLNLLHRAHYAFWVYWWPLWRRVYSGPHILSQWRRLSLVKQGQCVLDYGCGTGDFTIPAARMVGEQGQVYALDCGPRQLGIVDRESKKAGLSNIETILSNGKTTLPDESVDVVWMCDVLHEIRERRAVLEDLHRVLRPNGILAIHDGMRDRVLSYTRGLFALSGKDGKLYKFVKEAVSPA